MGSPEAIAKSGGTYLVIGIIFFIVSIAAGAAILFLEDLVATPLGKVGVFVVVLINFVLIGYIVVAVGGMRKEVARVVAKTPGLFLEIIPDILYALISPPIVC